MKESLIASNKTPSLRSGVPTQCIIGSAAWCFAQYLCATLHPLPKGSGICCTGLAPSRHHRVGRLWWRQLSPVSTAKKYLWRVYCRRRQARSPSFTLNIKAVSGRVFLVCAAKSLYFFKFRLAARLELLTAPAGVEH